MSRRSTNYFTQSAIIKKKKFTQSAFSTCVKLASIFFVENKFGSMPAKNQILLKIFVFCGKCCVRSGKIMFIIVKIKCVNSNNISDIYDKLNFITNYIPFIITDIKFIKKQMYYKF